MCLGSLFSHSNFLEFLSAVVEVEACNMLSVSSMAEDGDRCICFSQWMDLIVETLEFKLGALIFRSTTYGFNSLGD